MWKPTNFNLNCLRILEGNISDINKGIKKRFIIKNLPNDFDISCEAIHQRGYYPLKPLSDLEKNYPIAYARNVYNDYYTLELQFLISFAPQNHYCYAIDKKAKEFRNQVEKLAKCFDNIYITDINYDMTSGGINQALSSYECMKYLVKKKWKYLFVLQNDDFPLKTNLELVQILSARNGTMDIGYTNPNSLIKSRIDLSKKWDHKSLNFIKNNNTENFNNDLLNESMKFQKGYYPNGLPREAVEYIVNYINLTTYLNQINTGRYGEDEMVWQTLFNDNFLKIPQWVHEDCLSEYYTESTYMIRYAIWTRSNCKSKLFSHSLCVMGIEMLEDLKNIPQFFAYKFKSDQDMGAAICYAEYIYNKTYFSKSSDINIEYYLSLPQTKYQNTNFLEKTVIIESCKKNKKW
ncbi:Glycosyl transferase, family 14-containing protein [Strongyloides ratti]|uniref:Glycosyl transferase, family 14-containing protein n=1 Tax=Strongyloides ratti TaxID=34506 RepID=A0A090L2Y8_STRRB|nr:Glycosyl transferase, family 14-containing protein [Strongyloides ratti]CEF64166.1 Glycosyl transferase, family 14-containing protein [Strongyloides ratti]